MTRVRFGWRESRRLDTIGVAGEAADEVADDPFLVREADLRLGVGRSAPSTSAVCIRVDDCALLRLIAEVGLRGGAASALSLGGCFAGELVE
jgi:hypothetical protein